MTSTGKKLKRNAQRRIIVKLYIESSHGYTIRQRWAKPKKATWMRGEVRCVRLEWFATYDDGRFIAEDERAREHLKKQTHRYGPEYAGVFV